MPFGGNELFYSTFLAQLNIRDSPGLPLVEMQSAASSMPERGSFRGNRNMRRAYVHRGGIFGSALVNMRLTTEYATKYTKVLILEPVESRKSLDSVVNKATRDARYSLE